MKIRTGEFVPCPIYKENTMKNLALIAILCLGVLALAATNVSGSHTGTWTLSLSPYNIIGDVTIPVGGNLTIEPGVQIFAMGNYRITAAGTLTAEGTEADSIRFLNGQASPTALWGGIRLENTTQGSSIQHCYIENATYGINSINSPAIIKFNRFNKNQYGMQAYGIGNAAPPTVVIRQNLIEQSIRSGIYVVEQSNADIAFNEIRFNGTGTQYYGAIQLSNQSGSGHCSPTIANNHIHHNNKQGITAWDLMSVSAIQPQILNNNIENNLTGVYLLNSSGYVADNYIRNNYITGNANSGAGVMVAGATSAPYFERNDVYGNYTGFYLGTNAQPCLGDLASTDNRAQGGNRIYNNIDGSSILHSVYCYSYTNAAIVIKAENNYWGTNDASEIPLGIQDHFDDPALATVDFDPFVGANPAIPQNFSIVRGDGALILDWEAVTADEFGHPLNVDSYNVYAGFTPDFACTPDALYATVSDTGLDIQEASGTTQRMFFRVTANTGTTGF